MDDLIERWLAQLQRWMAKYKRWMAKERYGWLRGMGWLGYVRDRWLS
jgi:hypothetical protein